MQRTLAVLNAIALIAISVTALRPFQPESADQRESGPLPARQDPAEPSTVKVRELLLVDDEGNTRARLGLTDGVPELTFHTGNGDRRFRLGFVNGNDTGLEAFDAKGLQRTQLRCRDDGTSSLLFKDPVGANAFRVMAANGGPTMLDLTHADGGSAELRVMTAGQPDLALHDVEGRMRASLGVTASGLCSLALFDQVNANETTLFVPRDGIGGLSVIDERREPRVVVGMPFDPRARSVNAGQLPTVEIRDERGSALWRAMR